MPSTPRRTAILRREMLGGLGGSVALAIAGPAWAAAPPPVIIGKSGWLFPIWDSATFIDPRVIAQVSQTINTAIGLFQKANIQMAICLLPAKSRVYADFLPSGRKTNPAVERRYVDGLKSLAATGAITFDLASFLQACRKAAPQDDLYFKADTHWLPVGAASAAAEMANQIKAKAHLPASAQPGVTLSAPQPAPHSHDDLAALLSPAERAHYPTESYLTRVPVASGAASLLEDDAPDVVVVGNSFMQPDFGYAETLSSELNRPVGLAWRVHQFSPFWNMLDYLKSPAFTRQRPKLIVWTFHEVDLNTPLDSVEVWNDTAMKTPDFLAKLRSALGVS
jgi:alginate O-acetyltransferase complex protein AlgJ